MCAVHSDRPRTLVQSHPTKFRIKIMSTHVYLQHQDDGHRPMSGLQYALIGHHQLKYALYKIHGGDDFLLPT